MKRCFTTVTTKSNFGKGSNQKTLQNDFQTYSTFIKICAWNQNIPEFYKSNDCHNPYLSIFHKTRFIKCSCNKEHQQHSQNRHSKHHDLHLDMFPNKKYINSYQNKPNMAAANGKFTNLSFPTYLLLSQTRIKYM